MSFGVDNLVAVPADLDSVIDVGKEDDPLGVGVDPLVVDWIWAAVLEWYRLGTTPAIQVCVRREGAVLLNRSIGHAKGNVPGAAADAPTEALTVDSPFCGFSTAKGVAATVMFMLIEQGFFQLDDPVANYLTEFQRNGKQHITIGDILAHTAGIPFLPAGYSGSAVVFDEDLAAAALADLKPSWPRRRFRIYHALTAGLVQRLLVHRVTGKRMNDHLTEQVLNPLGFRWNRFGVNAEDVAQVVQSVKTGPPPSRVQTYLTGKAVGNGFSKTDKATTGAFLTAELPSGNLVTTANELSRFYEILTRGGELDGVRILNPDTLRTAIAPDAPLPRVGGRVSRGGFEIGGQRSKFGRNTETHFGRSGLTTQYGWADPARALSGAILTSGKSTADTDRPWKLVAQISNALPPITSPPFDAKNPR
ncbi:serine hydrolase domain-containing protein [Nocardia camponoti]|uniref:Hydrolase n=1 Tax=Nocardia camponoti TaxID=1616106 RepID=A0A917Q7H2_9NOCA|nr:serine hydrolase domain-containing protein [Nocardia camponoti]GGK33414.1 hydrolase [Nocardia camponoti]